MCTADVWSDKYLLICNTFQYDGFWRHKAQGVGDAENKLCRSLEAYGPKCPNNRLVKKCLV